jgi:ribosomal protein S18 acetylase RimI-like enzyme
MQTFEVRAAVDEDAEVIADFNQRLAQESENKTLDPPTLLAGVKALLSDSRKGRYLVACHDDQIVGQLMHTYEWSDWRNGDIWWLQSVYVIPEFRRRGVFRLLYETLNTDAESRPDVVGIRLYVELNNTHAQETYRNLKMRDAGYQVMERFMPRNP